MTFNPNNKFCWIDLMTSNPEESMKFYGELFRWTWKDGGSQESPYHFAQVGQEAVAGLAKSTPCPETGIETFWSTYFYTDDIDNCIEKAKELGASVFLPKTDAQGYGHFAVLKDPTNGFFNIWKSTEPPVQNYSQRKHGHPCWTELLTTDFDKSGSFYTQLFSWTPEMMNHDPNFSGYACMKSGEEMTAGMMAIKEEWGPMPTHWANSIHVDSCSETTKKARELGAKIMTDCLKIEGIGVFTTIQDPQGGFISFISNE